MPFQGRGRLPDLYTAAAMADMPNPAALQAVPPANVGPALGASQRQATEWVCIVDAPKDVPTPTRDVRIWAVLPNQKSGEGKSAVLAAAIGSKGNHPAESSGWPQKRKGPFRASLPKETFLSVCTMRASLTCILPGDMSRGPVFLSW